MEMRARILSEHVNFRTTPVGGLFLSEPPIGTAGHPSRGFFHENANFGPPLRCKLRFCGPISTGDASADTFVFSRAAIMAEPLTGQVYRVDCLTCGTHFAGTITRRGRRRRFCSERCRAEMVVKWKAQHRLKRRIEQRGPLLPFVDGADQADPSLRSAVARQTSALRVDAFRVFKGLCSADW
jgi:endogenous inhibitor of DNA gyrase (YacG/DUF329 family)